MTSTSLRIAVLALLPVAGLAAAVIGISPPSEPLTAERIANLPAAAQPAWREYLERSQQQAQADRAFFETELKTHGLTAPTMPPSGRDASSLPLQKDPAWYGGAEARRIADIVVSFQTPAGGWSKNINLAKHARQPGERFAAANASPVTPKSDDYDLPHESTWHYIGTFDNNATITELQFLAKVISAADATQAAPWRAAFLRGVDYVFNAQFPNGGWPQVWPLEGGYHDDVTYNDDAMINVLELVRDVAGGREEYAFVPAEIRTRAAASLARGVQCILVSQIVVNGHRTVWCQQHDALTLRPASARNYEMPSQTAAESSVIASFLMSLPHPEAAVVTAVHATAAWLKKTAIYGRALKFGPEGRHLVDQPGAGPLWARYYEIGTDRPLFGDRDKTIHDNMDEISAERRRGYSWYNETPKRMLEQYDGWVKDHPETKS